MTTLELLAPAKDLACGMAAVDHGADAVYIGAPRFGARAAATNSIDDIRRLCQYAHQFAVRVYVTLNTIIYNAELSEAQQLIMRLYDAGADALLVQDMGILLMERPPIALHASTQTDNRSADKVRWLRSLGFRRVVLARELSAEEIAAIHREVPDVELEVFVHGALCVSYSGLCYASQHCFRRSANRGECAQFCRMQFDLVDADGRELTHQRHLLSLKDLNQSRHLAQLIEAGATSFKIEGRLKDINYVKNVTAAYSQQLNAFIASHPGHYCRSSRGHCRYTFTPDLQKTFNRGFTTYFLQGRQPDIFSPDTPKAMGEFVGTVKDVFRDSFTVAGTASFANGDGLCFFGKERALEGFRINRAERNRLFPQQMPKGLRPRMALYRNNDQQFTHLLSRPSSERKIPVRFRLEAVGDGFLLSADGVSRRVSCAHQEAERPPHDNILRQLSKLGGTPLECSGVDLAPDFNYFIPSSLLADLRRQWVEEWSRQQCPDRGAEDKGDSTSPQQRPSHSAPMVPYEAGYLYNISNRLAEEFYHSQGLASQVPALELRSPAPGEELSSPLMQCRHCLRYAMGHCPKQRQANGAASTEWLKEPLSLRLADRRRFRLEFDCRRCQMNVYAEPSTRKRL